MAISLPFPQMPIKVV
ncbi:hypothetical protein BLA29_014634 [Euroglyphus maynei]|uniref:Uncharacterized protein n=1 Tax=Euroglyphus maynei TaxID=6958 RepID=A0A1Y3BIY9_EURMA|nr:hypothetical protein BLA29_014634 [Euroglyphus maynei]